jgi:hypothetical protein
MGGQQPAHGHTEPADQVGRLIVSMGSVRAVKPGRSANKNVWAVRSDCCAIAHHYLCPP